MNNSIKRKFRLPIVLIAIVVMLFSLIMVWSNSSDWGSVKMQRINFVYSMDGEEYTGSALVFSPKSATSDNKAPGITILGGASSYSYALKSFGIELSRRGYVAVLCDMPGQGQSSFVGHARGYGNYKEDAGTGTSGEDASGYIIAVTKELQNMDFVDQDKLTIAGFSAGQSWSAQCVGNFYQGVYKNCGTLSGYNTAYRDLALNAGVNFFGINGNANAVEGAAYEMIPGEICGVGSWEDGTADYCWRGESAVQHQMQPTTSTIVLATCKMMEMIYPTGTDIPENQSIFLTADIFSGVAIACMFILLGYLIRALIGMKFFESLKRETPKTFPQLFDDSKSRTSRMIKSTLFLAFRIFATIALYEIFGARWQIIPLFAGTAWAGLWFNIWVPFLICNAIVNIVIYLVWHFTCGKPNGGNPYEYGMTWNSKGLLNIGKCLVLGLAMVFVVTSLLNYLDILLTVNFKIMIFGMISFNMEHMLQMPFYIILYFFILFAASLTQYISHPSYSDGTAKGNVIATVRNTIICILPYLIMVIWNTLKGMNIIQMAEKHPVDQFAPLDNMYGYPIMMILVTPIMDMLYRKTKSIWPGVIVCAMLLGVLIACNYSLNETWFG